MGIDICTRKKTNTHKWHSSLGVCVIIFQIKDRYYRRASYTTERLTINEKVLKKTEIFQCRFFSPSDQYFISVDFGLSVITCPLSRTHMSFVISVLQVCCVVRM